MQPDSSGERERELCILLNHQDRDARPMQCFDDCVLGDELWRNAKRRLVEQLQFQTFGERK